ncbi:MAG TPA: glycosyltransferase, partial [Longimicrobiales bacterium]
MNHVLFAGGGTGGHLYPALALADALQQARPDVAVHFVGAQRGVEARVLPAEQRPHTLLPFEPLRRSRVWQNWRLVPSLWKSALGLRKLFHDFTPGLVVGTGGYASAPACLYAISRGVPVAIQEQNSHAGLTQRTVSRWARQVHLGFPEARQD